jgi:hypothetical protein
MLTQSTISNWLPDARTASILDTPTPVCTRAEVARHRGRVSAEVLYVAMYRVSWKMRLSVVKTTRCLH